MSPDSHQDGETAAMALRELCGEGLRHHQAGRLDEAERIYRRILDRDPAHADSLNLLGMVALQRGQPELALGLIIKAIEVNRSTAAYHGNLGNVLQTLRRSDEAEAAYRRALDLRPAYPEVLGNLGVVLKDQNRLIEAEITLREAIALKPDYARGHSNLGNVLRDLGRMADAEAAYRQSLVVAPDYAEGHNNLGVALQEMNRLDEAMESYRHAIALKPDYAKAHSNLGNALKAVGRLEEAIEAYHRAIGFDPAYANAHNNLGVALQDLGRLDEAMESYRRAIALKPDYYKAHSNLGVALQDQGRLDEAIASLRKSIGIKPDYAEGHNNLSLALLMSGDLPGGFREHEWRWLNPKFPGGKHRHSNRPLWGGEAGQGGTMLVWSEQGLGDSIQMARFIPELQARGWTVVMEVPAPLTRLLRSLDGVRVVALGDPLPAVAVQCPVMSLPWVLNTTLDTIPARLPYLAPDPDEVARWRERLAAHPDARIGLVWRGNPKHRRDRHRSLGAGQLARLTRAAPHRFVLLQKGAGADERAELGPVLDLGAELDDFAATAAVMANLDLVISVDTSVCHLAGALGRPTWTLVEFASEWRWMRDRDTSPWYPSMRLFRQAAQGDWDGVVAALASALESSPPARQTA